MDTISRESNPSVLPFVGLGLGALACVLAVVAIVKAGQVKTLKTEVDSLNNQVQSVAGDVSAAKDTANRANSFASSLAKQTQDGFNQVSGAMETMRADINKLATARTAPAPKAGKEGAAAGAAGAEKAGPGGDYTVKAGDTPAKIARAHGVSIDAIMAANPGLEPTKLKVGQKINLPK
ncbi:MAG TPA: LysM peptidoglycan-binding domain-containing protein [Opitutaceae bacterium]|nr:LysM peptidoglycan-binding domain-containing protein [Opitutaceae bacterium]